MLRLVKNITWLEPSRRRNTMNNEVIMARFSKSFKGVKFSAKFMADLKQRFEFNHVKIGIGGDEQENIYFLYVKPVGIGIKLREIKDGGAVNINTLFDFIAEQNLWGAFKGEWDKEQSMYVFDLNKNADAPEEE